VKISKIDGVENAQHHGMTDAQEACRVLSADLAAGILTSGQELATNQVVPAGSSNVTVEVQTTKATIINLCALLGSGAVGSTPMWDEFLETEVLVSRGRSIMLDKAELVRLVGACEQAGLKSVTRALIEDAVHLVAKDNPFDSAKDWLAQLPKWDGKARVSRFLPDYLATADTPYEAAVGTYLWTGMVGRIAFPGCKADMVPVLVGPQGVGKSTALMMLAPTTQHWGDACLVNRSTDLARNVWGKTLVAWEELRGIMGRRDADEVKAFLSCPHIELRDTSGKIMNRRHQRRFVIVGTSNRTDFLRDPTGNRRFLPFKVGQIDVERIAADKLQLYAEALEMVKHRMAKGQTPVDFEDAERLAQSEHQFYVKQAQWVNDKHLLAWLDCAPDWFTAEDALEALPHFRGCSSDAKLPDRTEMRKTLAQLGCVEQSKRVSGVRGIPQRWRNPNRSSRPTTSLRK